MISDGGQEHNSNYRGKGGGTMFWPQRWCPWQDQKHGPEMAAFVVNQALAQPSLLLLLPPRLLMSQPGAASGLSWACSGFLLGAILAGSGLALDLVRVSFFNACPGPALGFFCAWFGLALVLSWACPVLVLGWSWAWPGLVLGLV